MEPSFHTAIRSPRAVGGVGMAKVLKANLSQQLIDAQAVMGRDALQDAGQCFRPDGIMSRDNFMMLTIGLRSYPNVRTALPGSPVTQTPKRILQIRPVYITRQFHRARTSSRTKWRRIKPGRFIVPSK